MSIIKEFRIGNLVADYETEPHYFAIEEIGLYEDGELAVWYRNGSIMDKDPDPIPLTEEWLLKAGFELYDYEPNEEGDEFPDFIYMSYKITPPEKLYYYTITNTPEDGGYFDFCIKVQFADYVMLSTLQYVHQLQNLYFALTGKELEFKL